MLGLDASKSKNPSKQARKILSNPTVCASSLSKDGSGSVSDRVSAGFGSTVSVPNFRPRFFRFGYLKYRGFDAGL